VAGQRSLKVMANALMTGFQRIVHRVLPVPVGSRLRVTRYRHFMAACSVGKWPRARIARRYRALSDSIAFVEQSTFLLENLFKNLFRGVFDGTACEGGTIGNFCGITTCANSV